MDNLFLPFELALIAKEKGFAEPCFAYYNSITKEIGYTYPHPSKFHLNTPDKTFHSAPLYQQILDWFRDKHKIHFEISFERGIKTYYGNIFKESNNNRIDFNGKDYYDAITKGIIESFKLIK